MTQNPALVQLTENANQIYQLISKQKHIFAWQNAQHSKKLSIHNYSVYRNKWISQCHLD